MLKIIHLEEIKNLLLQAPQLVELLEKKDANAVSKIKAWLETLEAVFQNNRLPAVSIIAGFRGMLISAEIGILPDHITIHGRINTRKIKQAAAADVIKRVSDIAMEAIQADNDRIAKAEEIFQQIISLANAKGLVMFPPVDINHTESLKALWSRLSADQDIAPGTVNIEGLVGPNDSLIMLDRMLAKNSCS